MNQLDSFETALLAELRREVADHPRAVPAAPQRSRRRYAVAGLSAAAASAAVALGLGTLGGSPAYAVQTDGDGDVVVTVHRLDDAQGLEDALARQGIDADVSYDPQPSNGEVHLGDGPAEGAPTLPPLTEGGTQHAEGPTHEESGPAPEGDDPCGFGDPDSPPADLTQQGDDWVLTIPAGSPLQDRHLDIGTTVDGVLTVAYEGTEPGSHCGLAQINRPRP